MMVSFSVFFESASFPPAVEHSLSRSSEIFGVSLTILKKWRRSRNLLTQSAWSCTGLTIPITSCKSASIRCKWRRISSIITCCSDNIASMSSKSPIPVFVLRNYG